MDINHFLPSEILDHVFKYLNYGDLKNAKETCKKWNSQILALYRTHELTRYKVAINNSIIINGCSDFKINKKCNCKSTNLRFLGQYSCEIAPLPKCLDGHSIVINRNNEMMVVGGYEFAYEDRMFQDCLVYMNKKWVHHSTLNSPKYFSIAITMPNGIYVFGQKSYSGTETTAEFLGNGETQWKELKTNIPSPGLLFSDGVAISDEEIIFTGGKSLNNIQMWERITRYNVKMNAWLLGGRLIVPRWSHRSFVFKNKVIVCGGFNCRLADDFTGIQTEVLSSTEIISIPPTEVRRGGNLNEARFYHRMGILEIKGVPTLAAFGGRSDMSDTEKWLSSVELWDDTNERWIMSELSLPGPGYTFASCSSMENNAKGTSASKILLRFGLMKM